VEDTNRRGTATKLADGRNPSISHDGEKIAYWFLDNQAKPPFRIAIAPLTGGPPLEVLDMPSGINPFLVVPMRWTPDGQALTYLDTAKETAGIWILPLDRSKPKPLVRFQTDEVISFDLSPDRRRVVFALNLTTSDAVIAKIVP